jgi:hypothetical protein
VSSGSSTVSDDDLGRELRALDRRVRRRTLAVERLNPLVAPEAHAAGVDDVLALEAELRDLRARVDRDD